MEPCELPSQWSHPPPELLESISGYLTPISDLIRFRCVCRSWRSAARSSHLRPQIPILVLPNDTAAAARSFVDPNDGKVHTFHLPEARDHFVRGSSNGWLVIINRNLKVSLLNPLTRSTIRLPPASGTIVSGLMPTMKPDKLTLVFGIFNEPVQCYAFMGECNVVAFTKITSKCFVSCRPGDAEWTEVDSRLEGVFRGKLFFIDFGGNISVCEVRESDCTTILSLECRFFAT